MTSRQPWQGPPPSGPQTIIPSITSGNVTAPTIVPVIAQGAPLSFAITVPGLTPGASGVVTTPTQGPAPPPQCPPPSRPFPAGNQSLKGTPIPWGARISLRSLQVRGWLGVLKSQISGTAIAGILDRPSPWTITPIANPPGSSGVRVGDLLVLDRGTSQLLEATNTDELCGGHSVIVTPTGASPGVADIWTMTSVGNTGGTPLLYGDMVVMVVQLNLESLMACTGTSRSKTACECAATFPLAITRLDTTSPGTGQWSIEPAM